MTDLSDFGVGFDQEEDKGDTDGDVDRRRSYPNGRCPAITSQHRRRCRAPTSRMRDARPYCGTHGRQPSTWDIDDPAEKLILLTGELGALRLDRLDAEDVEFDLERIREAVVAVGGEIDD